MLFNRALPGLLQIFWLSPPLRLNFWSSVSKSNSPKCTTTHSTLLAILALYTCLMTYEPETSSIQWWVISITLRNFTKLSQIFHMDSSGDELANVNFYALRPEATEFAKITQNNGHYAVQDSVQDSAASRTAVLQCGTVCPQPCVKTCHWLHLRQNWKRTFSAVHNDSWRPPSAVAAVSRFRRRDIIDFTYLLTYSLQGH